MRGFRHAGRKGVIYPINCTLVPHLMLVKNECFFTLSEKVAPTFRLDSVGKKPAEKQIVFKIHVL
jgi:hypothetical protein